MLIAPRLDDLDYKALMDRARALIPTLTSEWTDFNDHDPGITTLQAFAWLCDGLNYYINATGERHRLKYFKLLGIEPASAAARCRMAVEAGGAGGYALPRASRLSAGGIPFELVEGCQGTSNRLCRLYAGADEGSLLDLTAFAGVDDQFASVFSADGKGGVLYLGFTQPLSGDLRLFFEIGDCGRNRFDDDFRLASHAWECLGADGWQPVEIRSDETGGFLRSGFLGLSLPCETVEGGPPDLGRAFYLRCRLLENDYDLPPKIGRVVLGCAQAVQQRSWAEGCSYIYGGGGTLALDRAVYEGMHITVAALEGDHYVLREEDCEIVPGGQPWLRAIRFDGDRFGWAPQAGDEILVIFTEDEMWDQTQIAETDGCAGQQIFFDAQGVLEIRLALIHPETGELTLWDRCDDLSQAGCGSRVFAFDDTSRTITFGDGICGQQPEPGLAVAVATLRTSSFEDGNVLRGQIRSLDFPALDGVGVYNIEAASGGSRRATTAELEPLLEQKLKKSTRAVTQEDYHAIVAQTPGLLIQGVAVIPMRDYAEATKAIYRPNTVVVAVQPGSARRLPALSERYRRRIRDHLEAARMLTTDIEVVPARYIGISVYGRISLTENNARNRERVADLLRERIETVSTGTFGRGVDYGRIFSALEMLDCVRNIQQLSFEYIGSGGQKNEHGDVVVHPDSLCYLDEAGIEFM